MTEENKNMETAKGQKPENKLVHFWLPAIGIAIVVAAFAGFVAYFWVTPLVDDQTSTVVYHKKTANNTQTTNSTANSNDQLNSDLKGVDAKLSNLNSASSTADSSLNDNPTNLN